MNMPPAHAHDLSKSRFNPIAHEQLAAFDRMPANGRLTRHAIELIFGISRATLWRRIREGKIPKPREARWIVSEIREVLANKCPPGAA